MFIKHLDELLRRIPKIKSFRGVNINSFDSIISRLLSFREAKPRRISKTYVIQSPQGEESRLLIVIQRLVRAEESLKLKVKGTHRCALSDGNCYRDSSVVALPLSDRELVARPISQFEFTPLSDDKLVVLTTNLTDFLPKWGGLRWGTALNKPLTTNILSFREAKPRRISKTISESYLLGFIKLTGKMLKQVQHDILIMEGLLCYP